MLTEESYEGSVPCATVCCCSEVGLVFHAVLLQFILDGVGEMLGSGQPGVVSYFEESSDLVHGTAMAVILPLPDSGAGHGVPGARPGRRRNVAMAVVLADNFVGDLNIALVADVAVGHVIFGIGVGGAINDVAVGLHGLAATRVEDGLRHAGAAVSFLRSIRKLPFVVTFKPIQGSVEAPFPKTLPELQRFRPVGKMDDGNGNEIAQESGRAKPAEFGC